MKRTQRVKRTAIVPFLRQGNWYARIPQMHQPAIVRALGVTDKAMAGKLCGFLSFLKGQGNYPTLNLLVSGDASILAAYQAWQANGLDAYLLGIHQAKADSDIEPLVAKWQEELVRVGRPEALTRDKYLEQVRKLLPESVPFPKSKFTEEEIRVFLSGYGKVARHYRAALSSFGGYLKDVAKVLDTNPVRSVKARAASKPRDRYLTQPDAKRLIDALEGEVRAWMALCAATGMEQQSLVRLTRRDIDLAERTVFANASKNDHRARTAYVYWRWDWAWEIFTGWLKQNPKLPDAKVFTVTQDYAYNVLRETAQRVSIEGFRPHDWRRTWGVQAAKDGIKLQAISRQLGHSNGATTIRIYAMWQTSAEDFRQNSTNDDTRRSTDQGGL